MVRVLLVLVALVLVVGLVLARLWVLGFPVKAAAKLAAFSGGFVVSVKMVLGGYLALQGTETPAVSDQLGFYGALVLALFFGVATLSLWRSGSSRPSAGT